MTSHRRARPRPIRRIRVEITLEADGASLEVASGGLRNSNVSDRTLRGVVTDTTDPDRAIEDLKRIGETLRSVSGDASKEFK